MSNNKIIMHNTLSNNSYINTHKYYLHRKLCINNSHLLLHVVQKSRFSMKSDEAIHFHCYDSQFL